MSTCPIHGQINFKLNGRCGQILNSKLHCNLCGKDNLKEVDVWDRTAGIKNHKNCGGDVTYRRVYCGEQVRR